MCQLVCVISKLEAVAMEFLEKQYSQAPMMDTCTIWKCSSASSFVELIMAMTHESVMNSHLSNPVVDENQLTVVNEDLLLFGNTV